MLSYESEPWKINEGDNRKLDIFFSGAYDESYKFDVLSNRDILQKKKLKTISTEVKTMEMGRKYRRNG